MQPPMQDNRWRWVYGSQGEGSWQMQSNGMWVETNPGGTFRYFEVGRAPDFIELQDQDRGIFVRLYDNREVHRGPSDPGWQPGYSGHWEG